MRKEITLMEWLIGIAFLAIIYAIQGRRDDANRREWREDYRRRMEYEEKWGEKPWDKEK